MSAIPTVFNLHNPLFLFSVHIENTAYSIKEPLSILMLMQGLLHYLKASRAVLSIYNSLSATISTLYEQALSEQDTL